jgi:hypothetical protein
MKSSKLIASGALRPAKRPARTATNALVEISAASAARTFFSE